MPGILPHLACAAVYAAVAALLHRELKSLGNHAHRLNALHWAVALPLLLHTWLLYRTVLHDGQIYLGVGNSLSTIVWMTVLIYWIGSFFYRLQGLQVFVLGYAALLVLAPAALPSPYPLPHTDLAGFRVHLLLSLAAFSLLTIASLQALMMAALERRLHGGSLPAYLQSLPPLLTLERLLFRILGAGFLLLTLTLASGMLFSEQIFGRPLQFTHKVVFGILAWVIFAALLAGRQIYGWRGRVALRWTLAGFVALLLAYIGSKFVIEFILRR
jgi:ABC-type uncharacterized transport system permease subunit